MARKSANFLYKSDRNLPGLARSAVAILLSVLGLASVLKKQPGMIPTFVMHPFCTQWFFSNLDLLCKLLITRALKNRFTLVIQMRRRLRRKLYQLPTVSPRDVVLISSQELGPQPFGLA